MQKEINFYQEMAPEHRLQEYCKGPVPLYLFEEFFLHPGPLIYRNVLVLQFTCIGILKINIMTTANMKSYKIKMSFLS